ncbi:hypothetical protein WICPIJ_008609 [Wickerhamomyces pijperi]|uniref:BHLH domain-containing protein n=1 Tax=Wickerhamomyces pijperi TaxID=599730 RepID=A0A9P8PWB2_WICPI|nr:hypothetical protein WICPIJ_008609 [Wickerhamomyces pijperi]
MGDEFWSFNNDRNQGDSSNDAKANFDDFNFNISSTIPENELMDFASPQALTSENYRNNNNNDSNSNGGFNINSNNNITAHDLLNNDDFINSLTSSYHDNLTHFNPSSLTTAAVGSHMTPSQLLQSRGSVPNDHSGMNNGGYLDPNVSSFRNNSNSASPYNISTSISRNSFQPTRHSSMYEDSISSPQPTNNISDVLQSQYFSPQGANGTSQSGQFLKAGPSSFQQSQVGSFVSSRNPSLAHPIRENSITSPMGSFNEAMSPYSYNDSSFKSPMSYGMSPATAAASGGTSVPKSQLSKEEKLKRRREFHNQVERRRRDLIKEKIKELGLIVPPSLLSRDSEGKDSKASKSVIINKSVEYIVHLNKVMEAQEKRQEILVQKIRELEQLPDVNGTMDSSEQQQQQHQQQHQQQQQQHHNQHQSQSSTPNNITGSTNQQFDTFTPSDSFNSYMPNFNDTSTQNLTPSQSDNFMVNQNNDADLGFDIAEFLKEQGVQAVGVNNPVSGTPGQW